MTVGDRIRQVRQEQDVTQQELADYIGVSKQAVYKYENNIVTNIPTDKVDAIAKRLKVSPAYLMGWEEEPTAQLDSEPANNFTEEDIQLLEALKALSPRDKSALLAQIAALNALQDQESKPSPNRKDDK